MEATKCSSSSLLEASTCRWAESCCASSSAEAEAADIDLSSAGDDGVVKSIVPVWP